MGRRSSPLPPRAIAPRSDAYHAKQDLRTRRDAISHQQNPPRVIIADDHKVVAEGLRSLLAPEYDVVAVVHSGLELPLALRKIPAECLLLDLVMPGHHGLPLLPTIKEIQPSMKIVVVTMLSDRCIAEACMRSGADAFVPKSGSREELLGAIGTVLAGRRYLSPHITRASQGVGLAARCPGLERLTPRQETILLMLGEGKRPAQIAAALQVGRSTVTFHLHNLLHVLGLQTMDVLVRLAVLHAEASERADGRRQTADGRRQTADGRRQTNELGRVAESHPRESA